MTDTLSIIGLTIPTIIGVHEWERQLQQSVELDLHLKLSHNKAAQTDSLTDALDYDQLSEKLRKFVGSLRCYLIEALAEEIAAHLLEYDAVSSLRLHLRKPAAVKQAKFVEICIERNR
ncbi:MAG: Dihydroneopterin aldolase [Gammaproteobacteria bacterium]|jgi:dihydroneopterin aldolase|nr:Dihydroneopterin aldolase [Gammaproteobacteria bacterium]